MFANTGCQQNAFHTIKPKKKLNIANRCKSFNDIQNNLMILQKKSVKLSSPYGYFLLKNNKQIKSKTTNKL